MQPNIPERTIINNNRCKHCGRKTYLQFIPIPNTEIKWILFDYPDGGLHNCIVKPLDPWKKKLVQQFTATAVEPTNEDDNNNAVVQKLNTIIEILNEIRMQD
jgi:hypothetical protein